MTIPKCAVIFALAASALALTAASAQARGAQCRIFGSGDTISDDYWPCVFLPENDGKGSFSLASADGPDTEVARGAVVVNVTIIAKGVADVQGLTRDGINSRWGTAKRAPESGDGCWDGADFEVCAK